MNEEQYAEIIKALGENSKEHESYNRRLREHDEALKKQTDILLVLEKQNGNIERLTGSMNRMEKSLENVDKRLNTIEQEPGDKWRKITFEIIKAVVIALVGVAVGFVINGMGK